MSLHTAGPDCTRSRVVADDVIDDLDRLAFTLDRFDDGASPARLNGDLWAGNRLVDVDGKSWLIDPAAHGVHREFDLAMMHLFGGFGAEVMSGYQGVSPLTDGWQDRIELHPDCTTRRPRHQIRRQLRRCGDQRHPALPVNAIPDQGGGGATFDSASR
jgi:hypothetical protein